MTFLKTHYLKALTIILKLQKLFITVFQLGILKAALSLYLLLNRLNMVSIQLK